MKATKKIFFTFIISLIVSSMVGQTNKSGAYQRAIAEYSQGHFEAAINFLNNDYLSVENDAIFALLRGDCYFAMRRFENALQDYTRAYKLKNKKALLKIARCYAESEDAQKAVEFLKEYLKTPNKLSQSEIKLMPSFAKIEHTKVWINLWKEEHYNSYEQKTDEAKYLMNKEDYANALDILDKLIIKNKRRHRAYVLRGDILMLNKDYKNAAHAYIKASEIKKHNNSYKIKAAEAFLRSKKYKKAENLYALIIQDPYYNPGILGNYVRTELHLKNYTEAETINKLFLSCFPNKAEAYYLAGLIQFNKGNNINALENLNKAIETDNSNAAYFIAAGDAYLKTNTFESAVYVYSMALDLNPKLAEVWYKSGLAKIKLHRYSEACSDLKTAKLLNYNKADDLLFKYCK